GSTSGDATSIYQEGIRIPLVRICTAGQLNQEIVDFILLNSRTPAERDGDLGAQIAANRTGARQLAAVVGRYGIEAYFQGLEMLIDYAEKLMRANIAKLPSGTYSFTDYLDDDGINLGVPVPITLAVRIDGDQALV